MFSSDSRIGMARIVDPLYLAAVPRFGSLFGLTLMLAACGGAAPTQPAASGAAAPSAAGKPAQMTKLRLGTPSAAAPSLVVPLTKDAGLYQKYGLEGEVQVVEGAKNLLAGMFNGELPITYQGSPEVINAALGGADVVMFAGAINTIFFSIYTRPDVTDAQQLKGKKIGYTFGGNDEAGAKLALTHLGLRVPQDISPVNMAGGQAARIAVHFRGQAPRPQRAHQRGRFESGVPVGHLRYDAQLPAQQPRRGGALHQGDLRGSQVHADQQGGEH